MFDPKGFENSRPDGFSVLEVVSELSRLSSVRRFVPLKHTCVTGEIAGPLADLRLTQTFLYTSRECSDVLEALYRFPLPGDAAVIGVTVRFGDTTIHAELKERAQAEADYEAARQQGRQATLTTRESPDVFTLHVTGLKPDQEVVVETAYVQLARYEGSDWTLRVPLTTAPRYVREDEGNSRHTYGQPLALLRDPGHRFVLNLLFRNSQNIQSETHALQVEMEEAGRRVRLRDGEVVPNQDCVLAWRAQQSLLQPALHLFLHNDPATAQVYFLALLAPPTAVPANQLVPREAVLLIDHSGSMQGDKWEATDRTVTRFLKGMRPQDTFALGLFHDSTRWFAEKPIAATLQNVTASVKFLKRNRDSGGTNLGVALEQALHLPQTTDSRARHLLIVTDAEVSDGGRLLQLASAEATQPQGRRISVICIDAAPNALLANELAERGGGVCRFLTSDPEQEDVEAALDSLLQDWSAPVLHGLRLVVDRPKAEVVEHTVQPQSQGDNCSIDIGDLPAGRAVWIAGRVPVGDSPHLSFRLVTAEGSEVAACQQDLDVTEEHRPALKALFGARRVLGLEYLMTGDYTGEDLHDRLAHLGYDPYTALIGPSQRGRLYRENQQQDTRTVLRGLLVREALEYGLASAETAFIAVGSEAEAIPQKTVAIPNALPSGWSPLMAGDMCGSMREVTAAYGTGSNGDINCDECDSGLDGADDGERISYVYPNIVQKTIHALGNLLRGGGKPQGAIQVPGLGVVFSGVPVFDHGEAILFESATADTPFWSGCIALFEVSFPQGPPSDLDSELELLLFIGDLTAPRMCVRLSELMHQGGMHPVNIVKEKWEGLRLVLRDPKGIWREFAPELIVTMK